MASDFNSVQGSVTLRKMRTGSTASVSLSSDKQLFQLYQPDGNGGYNYYPNWSTNNVTVQVQAAVSGDDALTVTAVMWKLNGQNVESFNSADNTKFDTTVIGRLVIKTNVADPAILNLNSGVLTAEISCKDKSGNTYTITKTEMIRVQEMVQDGYYVFINSGRGYVDANDTTPDCTLTAMCMQNGNDVSASVTLTWYRGTGTSSGELLGVCANNQLVVTPAMVNGTQLFVCRATNGSGIEVDAEGVVILDKSDPCYIKVTVTPKQGSNNFGVPMENVTGAEIAQGSDNAVVTFEVVKPDGTAYGSVYGWEAVKTHAATLQYIEEVAGQDYTKSTATKTTYCQQTSNTSSSVSITVYDKDYSRLDTTQSPSVVVVDEVIVTATATLEAPTT